MLWEAAVAKFGTPFRHIPAIVSPVYYGFNMVYPKIEAETAVRYLRLNVKQAHM